MPASSLQKMREQLRKDVLIKMTKRRIIHKIFDQVKSVKPGIENLKPYLTGMPALLFTKENPFKLYKTLQQSKSPAPAKAGQKAPREIMVPAGVTPFAPGPIISELGSVGIKAGVEGGKVAIKMDCVVAEEGQEIDAKLASILTRLGIQPMEIGLVLTAVYENGAIFDSKVLHIDEKEFMQKLSDAATWAINLSVEAGYPTKDTIEIMISKAFKDSKGLALEANIMADAVAEEIVIKAERQMLSVKQEANIDIPHKA
jgi:large subunit ribosomal protein L10